MTDVSLRIMMSAVGSSVVSSALQSIGNALKSDNGIMGALKGVGVVAGASAIALGVTSVQAAGDFQNAMDQNVAHAGLAASQVDTVNQALLAMGPAVGKGPTELAKALYPVLSGFSGISDQSAKTQVSLTELADAAKSVAGTTTDTTTVTNAATAAFNALGLQSNDAGTDVSRMNTLFDQMNATVTAGNMKWSDYAQTAGKLALGIKGTNVQWTESNAALATLTSSGYPSAQLAGDALNNLFTEMDVKADNVAKQAKALGLNFNETAFKTMDLAHQVQYLAQISGDDPGKLQKLLGGSTVALKAFNALSTGMKTYQGDLASINNSQGATAQAFEKASSSFNFAMQRVQAAGQTLLITIGTGLLPVLTNLANAVIPVIGSFTAWIGSGQATRDVMGTLQPILAYLGPLFTGLGSAVMHLARVIGPLLAQFGQWLQSSGTLQAVIGGVVLAVGLLIQALTGIINGLASVISFFSRNQIAADILIGVLAGVTAAFIAIQVAAIAPLIPMLFGLITMLAGGVVPALGAMAVAAWAAIAPLLPFIAIGIAVAAVVALIILAIQHWGAIVGWLKGVFGPIGAWFHDRFMEAYNGIKSALTPVIAAIQLIVNAINATRAGFAQAFGGIVQIVSGAIAVVTGIIDFFVDLVTGHFDKLGGDLGAIWGGICGIFEGAWNYVAGIWGAASGFFGSIASGIQGAFSGIVGFFQNIGNGIWNALKSGINNIIAGINTFIGFINGIHIDIPKVDVGPVHIGGGSISLPHIPSIPMLAEGGNITVGGLAVVGENGPELVDLPAGARVTPLSGGRAQGSGATIIFAPNVTLQGLDEGSLQKASRWLLREFGDQVRAQYGNVW